eukprot:GHVQ01010677.1.p1 GENE.GHVQ01010677.1~~GHVQ01010677.1.p1  ORF type:complete len:351 (+),score=53.92 GHVQ01010677.1:257-1309(+)
MGLPRIACHWLLSLSVLSILFVFAHSTLQPQTETLANDSAHPLPIPPWVGKQRITCTTTSAGTPLSDNCSTTAVPDVMHIDSIPPQSDDYSTNDDNTQNPDNRRLEAANNNSNNSNNSNMIHYTTGYLNPNRSLSSSSTTAVHTRQLSGMKDWAEAALDWVARNGVLDHTVYNHVSSTKQVTEDVTNYAQDQFAITKKVLKKPLTSSLRSVVSLLTALVTVVSTLLYPLVFMAILRDLVRGKIDKMLIGSFVGMLAFSPFHMAFDADFTDESEDDSTKSKVRLAMIVGSSLNLVYAVSSVLGRSDILSSWFGRKSIAGGTLIGVTVLMMTIYTQAKESLNAFVVGRSSMD